MCSLGGGLRSPSALVTYTIPENTSNVFLCKKENISLQVLFLKFNSFIWNFGLSRNMFSSLLKFVLRKEWRVMRF